jgi:Outer membrane protein beta-barrel domain
LYTCFAQRNDPHGKFSIGIDVGIPLSDYDSFLMSNLFKYGTGGSLKFDIPTPVSNFFVTLSGGITTFQASNQTKTRINEISGGRGASSADYAPLKIGVKYYFSDGFYGEAQFGAVIQTGPSVQFSTDNDVSLAYSPGIGYSFDNGIEIGARYEQWKTGGSVGTLSQLGIRVAYAFKLPVKPPPH